MKQKFLKYFKLLFGFILMNLFSFGFSKTKTGAKTTPRVPNLSYFDGWAPQLSARFNRRDRSYINNNFYSSIINLDLLFIMI